MKSPRILVVDDEPSAVQVMAGLIDDLGEVFAATSGEQALAVARSCEPDLVLLDANMPGMSGYDVCRDLKSDPQLADVPVIFVTAQSEPEFEVSGFDIGAVDFIAKPVQGALVRARVKTQLKIKQLGDQLRRHAFEDPLTGLASRRRFDEVLARELGRAQRNHDAMTLLMVDVDHFKRYNDHCGHPAGDEALRRVAQALQQACRRPADLVARLGGEEFAVLLPQTPLATAGPVIDRVLGQVRALGIAHDAVGPGATLSVSVGASACCDHEPLLTERDLPALAARLVQAADQALYAAKAAGRDCARMQPSGPPVMPPAAEG